MKILLVEDDHFQTEDICEALRDAFPEVKIETIDSEHDFYGRLDVREEAAPDGIIMDGMLRWAHPSPEMPPAPEEVINEKHYRAGFRCLRRLAEHKEARKINVILYTVLQPVDIKSEIEALNALPMNGTYLVKESNYNAFIREIRGFNIDR